MDSLDRDVTRKWGVEYMTTFFELVVRGENGRVWYLADTKRTEDKSEIERRASELQSRYPHLCFDASEANVLRKLAPKNYRPWGGDVEL